MNREFKKSDLEAFAGESRSMLDRAFINAHPPSRIEASLAKEALFYREWVEKLLYTLIDSELGRTGMPAGKLRMHVVNLKTTIEYGRSAYESRCQECAGTARNNQGEMCSVCY